jgi:outer membrane receptor protein involved in Fe transport
MWTTYRFHQGPLGRFVVGGGAKYVDTRLVHPLTRFRLPAYTRWDAMASYQIMQDRWSVQVNVKDLSNRTYYETDALFALIFPYSRTVQASIRFQY